MPDRPTEESPTYPGGRKASPAVLKAAALLADAVQADHGTRHGRTPLYWHLVAVAEAHALWAAAEPPPGPAPGGGAG
jgi:hypothetical protein